MEENLLATMGENESLKAFAVILSRFIAKYPDALLEFQKIRPVDGEGWLELYQDFQDKSVLERFSNNVENTARNYDWSRVEDVFVKWGEFGWVIDSHVGQIGFWDYCPESSDEADRKVLSKISDEYLVKLRSNLEERTSNKAIFEDILFCLDNHRYYACATLLASLIDGALISSPHNGNTSNRKTGEGAGKKIINELEKDDFLGLPGLFNLEIKNYHAFICTFFARANGFFTEPLSLNRNFLQHGMSKREITRTDCIKLLMAYRKTIALTSGNRAKE